MNIFQNNTAPSLPAWKAWVLACRPKTLTAALIPIAVGTSLASLNVNHLDLSVVVWALLGAVFIQIGTNLANDAFDFKKGADTEARLGPMRVTQSGLLSERQVLAVAAACFAIATICTIPLVYVGGIPIICVLILSVLCGFFYTGGPYPLAYIGLGDLFVLLFFGLVATSTTYYLQTGFISMKAMIAGMQIGMLATVLIAINNLRDREQDQKVGKNTLAVVLGIAGSKGEIVFLLLFTYLLNGYWLLNGHVMAGLLPLMTLPLVVFLINRVVNTPPSAAYNSLLGLAALIHMQFGLLFSVGLWIT